MARPVSLISNNSGEEFIEEQEWPNQKKYCGNRLTKGWFLALVSISIVLVILSTVLIGIFVLGRGMAQHAVNDSKIDISSMTIQAIKSNSLSVKMSGQVQNYAALAADMAEAHMEMYFDGEQFAKVVMPKLELSAAGSTVLSVENELQVSNTSIFTKFTYHMMSNPQTIISLKGKVTVESMGISFSDLKMDKEIIIYGLNNFNNPKPRILRQSVLDATADEVILSIDSCLNNNGTTSINNMGTLTLDIVFEDTVVGYAVAGSSGTLSLIKGENCWTMEGHIVRNEKNRMVVQKLIGSVASPDEITLTLRGSAKTSKYDLFKDAMAQMETAATFSPLGVMDVNSAGPNSMEFSANYPTASYGISPISMMQFSTTSPVKNLPYPIQTVFNPTPSMYDYLIKPLGEGSILGGEPIPEDSTCAALGLAKTTCVSELDLSSTTYIDVKALVYNPLGTELKIFGSELFVYFSYQNEWNCAVEAIDMKEPAKHRYTKSEFLNTCLNVTDQCEFNDKNHGSFHMATSLKYPGDEPLITVKPFEKKLFYQRLCLSAASVSWMSAWLDYKVDRNADDAPYFMWLFANGTLDIELGGYRTKMATAQEIPIYGHYYKKDLTYPYKPRQWAKSQA